jgi:hypothetical protein
MVPLGAAGAHMRQNSHLKIPKKLKRVTLWIHPEGRVIGSLFLHLQNKYANGEETPRDILNHPAPFIVLQREDPDEIRFYNRASIVRVEYPLEQPLTDDSIMPLACRLYMMDGSIIVGSVKQPLPPGSARLYDYLNLGEERFVEIHVDESTICLVNKSYITYATHCGDNAHIAVQ